MKSEGFCSIILRLKNLLKGNKMRFKLFIITLSSFLLLVACDTRKRVKAPLPDQQAASPQLVKTAEHSIYVKDVIQAESYTYLYVLEGEKEYWIATAKQPIEKGMTLHYDGGMEMTDFTSKELDKTFESIWFVGKLSGLSSAASGMSHTRGMSADADISVDKVAGGVTVAELFEKKADYAGKTVSIRGQVTKVNSSIMGRNWVHVQDGTKAGDVFDVTITTKAQVQKGDVVVFNGTVALDKDFGAGYVYDLIIEEAELSKES